jgi:Ca2+-binding RTX toxin-like protein
MSLWCSRRPCPDLIAGGTGSDGIQGADGIDYLYGEDDNDDIFGGDSADLITGNAGDDTLSGGAGSDFLYGELGVDKFDLRPDVFAGDFDYIADLALGETIVLPNGSAPHLSYAQFGGDVIGTVAILGGGTYSFWVDGFGGAPLTIAQVQAQTLFQ